jgi:serine phosphatase RsbU (regulator of sigma subunit)
VNDDPAAEGGFPGTLPRRGPLAAAGLRLATGTDVASIVRLTLYAVVPALADAAGVCAAERFLQGDPPGNDDTAGVAVRRLGTRFTGASSSESFRPGETIVLAAGSPYVRCMRAGKPVIFARPDGQTLERADPGAREEFSRFASFLAVPIIAGDAAAGFLSLARTSQAPAFGDSDAAAAGYLAAHAGTGIANSVTLQRFRAIAATLQRGLMAADLPQPERLEVAGRCQPAAGQVIGGDWYDIIPLPGERTGIVVGDVMGHGPEAAAVMAQLRAAAHALAQLDLPPGELLRQVDRTTSTLRGVTLATCVYAVIDPSQQSCTLAAAGHLPAVLALPDGRTTAPDVPPGPALGLGLGLHPGAYGQARLKLPPGATLALYTDGLVESRTRPFEDGIHALRSQLARSRGTLDTVCDTLIRALAPRPDDDITLVLARIPAHLVT